MTGYWTWTVTPWRITGALLMMLATLALSWRQYRLGGRRRGEGWLESLRAVATGALLLTWFQPERVRLLSDGERSEVVVLLDRTGSMATTDVVEPDGVISREAWVSRYASPEWPGWAAIRERFRLRFEEFPARGDGRAPSEGTNLHEPLARQARAATPPRAVVLVSDGDWNEGPSPVEAATRLQAMGVPVFAVAAGAERPLPDLELESVRAPAYALLEELTTIPVVVRSYFDAPVTVDLVLLEEGTERARRTLSLGPLAQQATALTFAPEREGDRLFAVRVLPVAGESRTDNNERAFRMSVRREVLRVLIVETEPRWEYRYLRNAALRDPGVDARTLLLHPHLRPGGGLGYLSAFPRSRDELSRYDVIFLGDVGLGAGGLTEEQAGWIRDVVESQAAGLVFLPGPTGRWISLATGPLAPLLPVILEPDRPQGHGYSAEGRLQLTARGREHWVTMLAPTPDRNARIWANLPGFHWYAAVERAKPGAEVLAVHAQARNEYGRIPLIVVSSAGSGKVMFMGFDSAWRWRRGVEDLYHYRFWRQMFRWMAHQRRMVQGEGLRFFYAPESPVRGDRLVVQATPLDASGFPMTEATVEGVLVSPSGLETRFGLRAVEGAWAAYQGAADLREAGEYRLEVRCRETDHRVETRIVVATSPVEPVGRPARPEVLRELATITDGQFARTNTWDELVGALRDLPPPPPRRVVERWWSHPLWLAALVVLWAGYWVGRKALGRI